MQFLSNSYHASTLLKEIRFDQFISGEISFSNVLDQLNSYNPSFFDQDLDDAKSFLVYFKENDLPHVPVFKLKEFLSPIIEAPVIELISEPPKNTLRVKGMNLIIGDSLSTIEDLMTKQREANDRVTQVEFEAWCVHWNRSLSHDVWKETNLLVECNTLVIHGSIEWDLSGCHATHQYQNDAGTDSNGNG